MQLAEISFDEILNLTADVFFIVVIYLWVTIDQSK